MKHNLRFSLCVLLLLFVSAGTSFAVTVKGHDGSELALSEIPDIIRHVTGQTSGNFQFGKDSLYIYGAYTQGSSYNEHMEVYSFNIDGSNKHQASVKDDTSQPLATPLDYRNLSVINTAKLNATDNSKILLNFVSVYDGNLHTVERDGNFKGMWLDVKGGLDHKRL